MGNYRKVAIDYTNWRGERKKYVIVPQQISFGSNEFHKEPQWLMEAIVDLEGAPKYQLRTFAMKDIHSWEPKDG
jgi:hypothetical protein